MSGLDPSHWTARQGIVTMQSAMCGPNPILRFGDSLSEEMWMGMPTNPPTLLGHNANVLNFGLMGAGVTDLTAYRDYMLSAANPWCVLFQCGTNDCITGQPFDQLAWQAVFDAHVAAMVAHSSVVKVICKSIPPVFGPGVGYDQDHVNDLNRSIHNVCALHPKTTFLDLDPWLKCASTGYIRPGYTCDNTVHLSGYAAWTVAWLEYETVVGQALGPPPPPC